MIEYRKTKLYADLGAEGPIAVQRNEQKLVVEVKSFVGTSKLQDLKKALGQYDIYPYLLDETAPERKLYLAISSIAYKNFFTQDVIQLIVTRHQRLSEKSNWLHLSPLNPPSEQSLPWGTFTSK
nr:element excision factor XisH family protein [Moorena producens]